METIERVAPEDTTDTTEASVTIAESPSTIAVSAVAASVPPVPGAAPASEKELLCTICNLRACWETPAGS